MHVSAEAKVTRNKNLCMCVWYCRIPHTEDEEQLESCCILPLCGFQGSNWDHQACVTCIFTHGTILPNLASKFYCLTFWNPQTAAPCLWKTVAWKYPGTRVQNQMSLMHLPLNHPILDTLDLTSWAYVTVVVENFQIPDCCFTQPCPGLNSFFFFLFLVVVVFLSLQTDRELGIAAKECACSPLQLFWGCNPSGLGPVPPPPFLYPLTLCMFHKEV